MTRIIKEKELSLAKEALDCGDLVIFPTETVYGLGANALSYDSVDKIFKAKGRASNNPLIVHLKNKEEINKYARVLNDVERKLIDSFMPGPFTLILQKLDIIPDNVTAGLDTVGIRIPIDKVAHHLLDILDYPLAAPSANISSRPSGTRVWDIKKEFDGKVRYIIDGGESRIGLESTVCKVIDGIPTILRPGFITKEDIIDVVGKCNISEYVLKEAHGKVESPGMLYKHYAPKTKCLLVDKELLEEENRKYANALIIGNENKMYKHFYYYGNDNIEIAHNIFKLLRQADNENVEIILIQAVDTDGIGLAIMNRLIRTCEYRYIKRDNEDNKI